MHVAHVVDQAAVFAERDVVLDQMQRGLVAQVDEVAQMRRRFRRPSGGDEGQVQRRVCAGVVVHPYHRALLGERRVGHGEDFVAAGVAALQEVRVARFALQQHLRQRLRIDAARQRGDIAVRGIEAAIDEDQSRGRNCRQGLGDGRRVDGRSRRRRECASLQRAQRRVFPGFAARAGQAVAQCGGQRCATMRAEARGLALCKAVEGRGERIEQGAHRATVSGATRSLIHA